MWVIVVSFQYGSPAQVVTGEGTLIKLKLISDTQNAHCCVQLLLKEFVSVYIAIDLCNSEPEANWLTIIDLDLMVVESFR